MSSKSVKICDRCNKELNYSSGEMMATFNVGVGLPPIFGNWFHRVKHIDLCTECCNGMLEYLETGVKK